MERPVQCAAPEVIVMKLLVVRAAAVAAGVAWAGGAAASAPMGVFARVDKVEYEPSKAAATKVVIHGVFALQAGSGMFEYAGPYAGYMYFSCPQGADADCREQWGEIESNIGAARCVGWGQELVAPGSVRAAGAPLSNPDAYDLGMGVAYASYAGGWCPKLLAYGGAPARDGGAVDAPDAGQSAPERPTPPTAAPSTAPASSSAGASSETVTAGCAAAAATTPDLGAAGLAVAALALLRRRRSRKEAR